MATSSDDELFSDWAESLRPTSECDDAITKTIALVYYAERRIRLFGDLQDAADALAVAVRLLRQAAITQ
jgi:hypothetical protein